MIKPTTDDSPLDDETRTSDSDPKPKQAALVRAPVTAGGIAIQNLDELMGFARMLVADGAAPKRWTPGQVAIAIQSGMQVGLGLLGGVQQGAVINGIFSWRGQAAVALIQNSGKCKPGTLDFGCVGEGDQREGFAVAHRVRYASPKRFTFSVADAKLARLWNKEGPWTSSPPDMLAWRAVGRLAKQLFPDVLGGFPLAEEAVDYEDLSEKKPQRPELPPPPMHDPLMDAIKNPQAGVYNPGNIPDESVWNRDDKPPEVVEAELVPEAEPKILACEHGVAVVADCITCGPGGES